MSKNRPIQIMILLAVISLVGIIAIQIYWVSRAVEEQEQDFDHNVRMSLRAVADGMCQIDGNDLIENKPIDRVSRNYFVARLQYNIDISNLEQLITEQFETRGINIDYEYGVYNCENDRMVFGEFVSQSSGSENNQHKLKIPKLKDDEYYFGVYFPSKTAGLLSNMSLWKFMTVGTIVMLLFFGYGLIVVLKQRRLSEIQKDFINNVTHELKTPLATLKVAAEVIENNPSSDKIGKYANIVSQETARLESQVEQILSASLVEYSKKPVLEYINISNFLTKLADQMRLEFPNIIWGLQLSSEEFIHKTNVHKLETILRNLVDNAVKYGNGEVRIASKVVSNKFQIEIIDNGSGIPQKYEKRIFDKFFRIPTDNRHDVKGYGLGMYLVKENLKQIGGSIEMISSEKGTNFNLIFKNGN